MPAKAEQTGSFFGIIELMKNHNTQNNYGTLTRNVELKIDEMFAEKVIPANDNIRLLDQIVAEMNKTPLERRTQTQWSQTADDLLTLLSVRTALR